MWICRTCADKVAVDIRRLFAYRNSVDERQQTGALLIAATLTAAIRLRGEGSRSLGSVGFIGRANVPQNSGREQHSLIRAEISLIA